MFSAGPGIAPTACIFVRNTVHTFPLWDLCSGDVMMMKMTYTRGGSKRKLIVTLAYLPFDSDEPPPVKGVNGSR